MRFQWHYSNSINATFLCPRTEPGEAQQGQRPQPSPGHQASDGVSPHTLSQGQRKNRTACKTQTTKNRKGMA